MGKMWNLWHGCRKLSEGCQNCYVYRVDARYNRDATQISKNKCFDLPVRKRKNGDYSLPSDTFFWTCFTSDFLLKEADEWRKEAWKMIRERGDCKFLFITKRIERLTVNLPQDWGEGYDNVIIAVTCENQKRADERLPVFKSLPIKHRIFVHEPLLSPLDISPYLDKTVEEVVVGGESGAEARVCDFNWVLSIRDQCLAKDIPFKFKQTGTHFLKEGRLYKIPRKQQHSQAQKAELNYKTT